MPQTLADRYRAYLDCLNRQAWNELDRHVATIVRYNGRPLGLSRYRSMLVRDFEDIPDLHFEPAIILAEPPLVAARLTFNCTPRATFLGLPVNGRRVVFVENVFYQYQDTRISSVWSVIDKAAIEAQI
ncbi:putative ester cyclase [Amaricoccus macauensis]|uniref:Putative ester cyclase n=1 Tax=Amaricoccus macauensis TaxID=57001 RepID=A0A840STR8_9RHOB|nr:putative ester cyclase [Amaricoccus macauensis]